MKNQKHSMQPQPCHDESVRQDFVTDMRAFLTDEIYTMITPHYEKNIEPGFIQSNDRKPQDKSEVKSLMLNDRGYQSWSLLQRLSQQMMFTSVIDTIERNLDEMIEHYKHTSSPVLAERRKTYKDIKIALFGEDLDNENTGNKDTQVWLR